MKNTAFKVHVGQSSQEEVNNVNIEQGAMLVTDEYLFMGFNNEQVRVYPPQSNKMGLGWARYDDTQYTSLSPLTLVANVEVVMPNNAGNKIENILNSNISYYNGTTKKIQAENVNDVYVMTVFFKATAVNASDCWLDMKLANAGATQYERLGQSLFLKKGNNIEVKFHEVFQYYSDLDFITNGAQWKLISNKNIQIYDIIYFIQRTQNHKY
jgi:hypothetical protein